MRCEGRGLLRRDGFDLGNNPRIEKCIADTAVSGSYVECEHEFSRWPFIRQTRDGHDCGVGEA